jgi:hypothetical protein
LIDYLKKGCNVGAALVAALFENNTALFENNTALFENNAALFENNADTLEFQC